MKSLFSLLFFSLLSFSTSFAQKFTLVPGKSVIIWECADEFGRGHEGTLTPTTGTVEMNSEGIINKGEFKIDMGSIRNTDQPTEKNRKELEDHLKSADFFDVSQFPYAFFNISSVTKTNNGEYKIAGLLAIRGKINPVSFPATIKMNQATPTATGKLVINRTKWDINYQSKTIFGKLKDAAIADDIELTINLQFKKV